MNSQNQKLICPECEAINIKLRFKVDHQNKENVYSNVTEEIQCGECYMDIPSNVFIIDDNSSLELNKKQWHNIYKPEHIKKAARCSKCELYYWEIEKILINKKITSSNIFYQAYDVKGAGGNMVCILCDPEAFKNNKT